MIASLGMYDMPHLRAAHDRYWQAIIDALGYGPETLTRGGDPWAEWTSPDLLLSQTCGLPYRARLNGKVQLVGTPDYGLPDCPPGYYFSYLIRRRDDRRDLAALAQTGLFAFNDPLSQSGWAAPCAHLEARGLRPGRVVQTKSHLESIRRVLLNEADFAAVDAVTLLLWAAHDADAAVFLDMFDRTTPTPGLPYITALGQNADALAGSIKVALARLSRLDRHDLRLHDFVQIPAEDYMALPLPHAP